MAVSMSGLLPSLYGSLPLLAKQCNNAPIITSASSEEAASESPVVQVQIYSLKPSSIDLHRFVFVDISGQLFAVSATNLVEIKIKAAVTALTMGGRSSLYCDWQL